MIYLIINYAGLFCQNLSVLLIRGEPVKIVNMIAHRHIGECYSVKVEATILVQ